MQRNLPQHPNAGLPAAPPTVAAPAVVNPARIGSRVNRWRFDLREAANKKPSVINVARTILELDAKDTDLNKSKSYRNAISDLTLRETVQVLYHLDRKDMMAMIEGDYKTLRDSSTLPEQLVPAELQGDPVHNDTKLRKKDRLATLYQHWYVDPNGDSPTVEQLLQISRFCQHYLNVMKSAFKKETANPTSERWAEQMDQVVPAPSVAKAPRLPYTGKTPRYGYSKSSQEGLEQWIDCIRDIYYHTPAADRNKPLKQVLSETGWTVDSFLRRFHHHEHGTMSNKLMNIIDAAGRVVYRNEEFRWKWIIVMEVVAPHLGGPAERTLSRLCMSYTTCGGSNQEQGGLSVTSADQGLANIAYRETSNELADKMQKRMDEDRQYIEKALDTIRDAKKTEDKYRKIEENEEELKRAEQDLKVLEQDLDQAMEELKKVVPGWVERMTKHSQALDETRGVAEMAESMKRLLDAYKR
ncbi:Putative AH/BAR domain superfamily protein [Septoria linicola]|uniref:AH/BAR domain superfamily protein n=1 Tax=Septoria linicola TaxID=215465 RepID=A0A9Q9EHX8_9PEZI|nr:putative AH/BAR domain superfamily protein [Septoria linicola]USW50489.1 Putative AH/BAR domain superfamily protein [Septoria linicola]